MTKNDLKTIITPSFSQILLCLLISICITSIAYWETLINILARNTLTSTTSLSASFIGYLSSFGKLPFTGNLFIILFWGILAILIYCIGLVLANVLIDVRNSVVVKTRFTKPAGGRNVVGRLMVMAIQVVAVVVFIGVLVACGLLVFPLFIQIAGMAILSGLTLASSVLVVGAICGTALALYVLWTLAQLVFTLL
ncbi:MAG TPA: hypothetical protein VF272_03090 [Candidatus Saccharimonadia bacterium]